MTAQPATARHDNLRPLVANWQRQTWQVFARHDIAYAPVDTVRTSQVLACRLRLHDTGKLTKALSLGEQLALALGVQSVRCSRHLGYLDVEIALPATHHRALPAGVLKRKGGAWITLGHTAFGTPVHVNMAGALAPHALIAGTTGCGKTVAGQLIAWTLASGNDPCHVQLLLIDGAKKGAAWYGFEREAHLIHPIVKDSNEAVSALSWAVAELDQRMEQRRHGPRLFILIDEVRALLNIAGKDVALAIEYIASTGREFGVHIIVATQHALSDGLGGSIAKANLSMRLTGRCTDANAAYLATGVRGSGAERLQRHGDFLLTVAGASHRLQVAQPGRRDIVHLPRASTVSQLDLDLHLNRVLDVADAPRSSERARKSVEDEPHAVAYALASGCGVPALRERFGPMGTRRAQRIRDFANTVRQALADFGYTYPLPLTQISRQTAQQVGIDIPVSKG